jgi:hypothetical protein
MMRALITACLCGAAVIAGDALFRTSLLRQVRPVIVTPSDNAAVEPPVHVLWEGPQRMRVLLSGPGEEPRDLGVHESPLDIAADQFPQEGAYRVQLHALWLGSWITADRWFQLHNTQAAAAQEEDHKAHTWEAKDILRALEAARTARDKAQGRAKFLNEENAALRDEMARLSQQVETLYKTQEDDAEQSADLERRLTQLSEEQRALAEENGAMRLRLGSVIPCTVWGYYNYPRPNTIPPSRRLVMVSDLRGEIFRSQVDCEVARRSDPTAASICFCVGNSWGG